jgi:hypothetical protein
MIKGIKPILFCNKWDETVRFCEDRINLPIVFPFDWFMVFSLNESFRSSTVDETRRQW